MNHTPTASVTCQICKRPHRMSNVVPAEMIGQPVLDTIRRGHPDLAPEGYVCLPDLNRYRARYVEEVLELEKGDLSKLDADVVESLKEQDLLTTNINVEFERVLTFGERMSDHLAEFGGSWTFVLFFLGVLAVWIAFNTAAMFWRPFDPFPYILLNLVLSCIAALQAPIIMMSQNRQEAKDRLRAEHDYRINLKAELEVRQLSLKIDQLLTHQWQRLLEIQRIQTELMQELTTARHHQR